VNATGVVIHTNLGRAPLARAAREAMEDATCGYANLEIDLQAGRRGSRYAHCVELLTELTGAEDALVVNNCAAGLMLALNTVARGAGVVVSRGELVEIGGGFRVPEILERSGARLVEVGSTNRTRPEDYRAALDDGTARAVLKVHRSNFRMTGFTEEARLEELRPVARAAGVPLLHDLGSGLLADPAALGLPPEPRAPESVEAGADLVIISGDKLLGGPQSGIVVGRGELVAALRTNPMCRALRVDKATLAGLEATLRLYRDPAAALREIPVLRMLSTPLEALQERARRLAGLLEGTAEGAVEARPGRGAVGGGTFPGVELDSWTVRLPPGPGGADARARALRIGAPPVVGRIEEGRVVLDLRTVAREEDGVLLERLRGVLEET
jgi:L-seryl-tRNA(Ser) seleniumtransferase